MVTAGKGVVCSRPLQPTRVGYDWQAGGGSPANRVGGLSGRGLQAPPAGGVPAGDQGHPGSGQGHLDDELDPVDPSGDTNAERVGDERPDEGSTDADQDSESDGDVLAAGEH